MKTKIRDVLDIGPHCYERFISPEKLKEVAALEIELAGCSNLSGNYHVGRTRPADHTLFYTLSGQGKLITPTQAFELKPSSLAILPATQGFEVSIAAEKWDIVWVNLANTMRWQHLQFNQAMVVDKSQLGPLHLAFELLYSESNEQLRKGLAPILSFYLNNLLNANHQDNKHDRLDVLFQEIEKRLQFDWNIEAMCDFVHYSSAHLHRLCQLKYEKSPIQQLIYIRIQRAKNLLLYTTWPVTDIAIYVGYSNLFNFSKRFKQSTGTSPSEFRRKAGMPNSVE